MWYIFLLLESSYHGHKKLISNVLPCMSFSSRVFDKLWHWDVAEVVSPIEDLKTEDVKTMNMQNKYTKSTLFLLDSFDI